MSVFGQLVRIKQQILKEINIFNEHLVSDVLHIHHTELSPRPDIDWLSALFPDGKLDVFQHNKLLTSISVWTTFGELAILYNCTRTASVKGSCFPSS